MHAERKKRHGYGEGLFKMQVGHGAPEVGCVFSRIGNNCPRSAADVDAEFMVYK